MATVGKRAVRLWSAAFNGASRKSYANWKPALSATDRRYKAANAAHIEESMRCILEARSEREYEIAYQAFLLGCVWPVSSAH
jgi:hypothetical protein